jgi:hypothetical protein
LIHIQLLICREIDESGFEEINTMDISFKGSRLDDSEWENYIFIIIKIPNFNISLTSLCYNQLAVKNRKKM